MSHLYHAFGPGDITCVAITPGKAFVLEEVTDFSVSSHFDKIPVRRLGHRLPVGWATGAGSVAGTLVCAQFTHGALWKLRRLAATVRLLRDSIASGNATQTDGITRARTDFFTAGILPQQLPPFHLMFVHENQDGQMAIARLYNVTITDHGEVKGSHNLFTEETLQFQALYYEQIRLHKSMTIEQMQALVKLQFKPTNQSFFNDPRRPQSLDDVLLSALSGTETTNPLEYLLSETEMAAQRLAEGKEVSINIADEGDVVWISQEDTTTGERTQEVQSKRHAPDEKMTEIAEPRSINITDTLLYEEGGVLTSQSVSATLHLEDKAGFYLPRIAGSLADTADKQTGVRTGNIFLNSVDVAGAPTASFAMTTTGSKYREALALAAGRDVQSLRFTGPIRFEIVDGMETVVKSMALVDSPILTATETVAGAAGTFRRETGGLEERYTVTKAGSTFTLAEARFGPTTLVTPVVFSAGKATIQTEGTGMPHTDASTFEHDLEFVRSGNELRLMRTASRRIAGQMTHDNATYTNNLAGLIDNGNVNLVWKDVAGGTLTFIATEWTNTATIPQTGFIQYQTGDAPAQVRSISLTTPDWQVITPGLEVKVVPSATGVVIQASVILDYQSRLVSDSGDTHTSYQTISGTYAGWAVAILLSGTTVLEGSTIGSFTVPAGTEVDEAVEILGSGITVTLTNTSGNNYQLVFDHPAKTL